LSHFILSNQSQLRSWLITFLTACFLIRASQSDFGGFGAVDLPPKTLQVWDRLSSLWTRLLRKKFPPSSGARVASSLETLGHLTRSQRRMSDFSLVPPSQNGPCTAAFSCTGQSA